MMSSDQIAKARKAHGLTQAQLARILCVDVGTISRWERGIAEPLRDEHRDALSSPGALWDTLARTWAESGGSKISLDSEAGEDYI